MGAALAQGWCRHTLTPDALILLDRSPHKREAFYKTHSFSFVTSMKALQEHNPRVLCLAVKPAQAALVLEDIALHFAHQAPLIVTIIAGLPLSFYENRLWPGASIIRMMPNTPSEIGAGLCGLFANSRATASDKAIAESLMQSVGKIIWLQKESQMHALTAISGSGPAYIFYMMELLQAAALAQGFSQNDAKLLCQQTVLGAAQLAAFRGDSFAQLRDQVTSPKGTTQAGLRVLMHGHLETLLQETIAAAKARSEALAEEVLLYSAQKS